MSKNTSKSKVVAKNDHPVPPNSKLTPTEQTELKECEKTISSNFLGAFELAQALHRISAKKLYRAEYDTFEEYCSKKWEYGRSYCHRLAKMHEVVTELKQLPDVKDTIIRNESQARVFVDLPTSDRVKLLNKAKDIDDPETITAKELTKLKKELFPEKCPPKKEKPVIDVEASVKTAPELPSVPRVNQLAKDVLQCLKEMNDDEDTFADELRELIKETDTWLAYHKANKK